MEYNGYLRGVAQRLARHVRDVEVGGSNPLTPTIPHPSANEVGELRLTVAIGPTEAMPYRSDELPRTFLGSLHPAMRPTHLGGSTEW